jgi:hypothetical protein
MPHGPRFECRFAFKGWQRFWRCRVQLQSPLLELRGSFEGTPAQTPETPGLKHGEMEV